MVVVVSLWIFTSEAVLECHVLERLSRAPRDRQPQRDRAMPAPLAHTGKSYRRTNGPQPKNSFRDRNERRNEPSPIPDMAGDRKNMVIPVRYSNKTLHDRAHVLLAVRAAVNLFMVDGSVGWWVGCCTCCCCMRSATAVVLLYICLLYTSPSPRD